MGKILGLKINTLYFPSWNSYKINAFDNQKTILITVLCCTSIFFMFWDSVRSDGASESLSWKLVKSSTEVKQDAVKHVFIENYAVEIDLLAVPSVSKHEAGCVKIRLIHK